MIMRQTKDYNCGVFAIQYILRLKGVLCPDIEILEKELNTSKKDGTPHEEMARYLTERNIPFGRCNGAITDFPTLVTYRYEDEDHYGVIININERLLWLYNPATGDIDMMRIKDFLNVWKCRRYGDKFGLII
jgi:predicted double-glycine peptidase